jgi:hypothetical protein
LVGSATTRPNFLPGFTMGMMVASPFHPDPVLAFLTKTRAVASTFELALPLLLFGAKAPIEDEGLVSPSTLL